jgi:hypothetical protein
LGIGHLVDVLTDRCVRVCGCAYLFAWTLAVCTWACVSFGGGGSIDMLVDMLTDR